MSTRPPIFIDTRLPSPITEFAPQIMSNFGGGREQYASGTAVIVAPHLAFAARHVLEEHYRRYYDGPLPDGELTVGFSFLLAQLVGEQVNLWTVERLWAAALTDIFLLSLKPLSEGAAKYQFKHLALDLLPPAVGEEISAFGYCDNTVETSSKAISVRL